MMVKLEMGFESLDELRKYLESTLPKQDCCCAKPVPNPMPVDLEPKAVPQMAPPIPTVPPTEAEVIAPPPMAIATPPVETAPTPMPQADMQASAPSPEVSTAAHTYKLNDISRAGSELVDIGKQSEIPKLMARFGITSLPELPPEKYGEMAAALRELGAKI